MKVHRRACSILIAVAALSGCATAVEDPGYEPVLSKPAAVTYANGDMLHPLGFLQHVLGRGLNGIDIDGTVLEGTHVAYVRLDSATHDGKPMSSVSLEESTFRGRTAKRKWLARRDFTDVEFTAVTDAGTEVKLRLESSRRWLKPGLLNAFLHEVKVRQSDGWRPLCGADETGAPVEAVALGGHWDHREGVVGGGAKIDDPATFTFACLGRVAAKCVEMGYMPWRRALVCHAGEGCEVQDIGHLHQACTRMLRGDYCGDGTAHTIDGMSVNVYDGFAIREDSEDWEVEAEWTTEGARCVSRTRMEEEEPVWCLDALQLTECGEMAHLARESLLISEVP